MSTVLTSHRRTTEHTEQETQPVVTLTRPGIALLVLTLTTLVGAMLDVAHDWDNGTFGRYSPAFLAAGAAAIVVIFAYFGLCGVREAQRAQIAQHVQLQETVEQTVQATRDACAQVVIDAHMELLRRVNKMGEQWRADDDATHRAMLGFIRATAAQAEEVDARVGELSTKVARVGGRIDQLEIDRLDDTIAAGPGGHPTLRSVR